MKNPFTGLVHKTRQVINRAKSISWRNQLGFLTAISLSALLIFTIMWEIYDGYSLAKSTSEKTLENQMLTSKARTQPNARIEKWTIFGKEETIKNAKENTSLTLFGILQADNKKRSKAIIGQPRQDAEIYAVGDEIAKGLKLHKVEQDHVVLKRFGTYETLYLVWDDGGSGHISKTKKKRRYSSQKTISKPTPISRSKRSKGRGKRSTEAREKYMERMKNLRESGKYKDYFKKYNLDRFEDLEGLKGPGGPRGSGRFRRR